MTNTNDDAVKFKDVKVMRRVNSNYFLVTIDLTVWMLKSNAAGDVVYASDAVKFKDVDAFAHEPQAEFIEVENHNLLPDPIILTILEKRKEPGCPVCGELEFTGHCDKFPIYHLEHGALLYQRHESVFESEPTTCTNCDWAVPKHMKIK